MDVFYRVYINDNLIYECSNREEAHDYINKNHRDLLPFLNYEPLGAGSLEHWGNGILSIKIIRLRERRLNVIKLLNSFDDGEKMVREREIPTVNVEKVSPLTPRRTRIKSKDRVEKAGEGKEKVDKEGNLWVCKKNRRGEYKWIRHYEENYENKRKCPKFPAKQYTEGTVKKGLDGKMWKVKLLNSGTKKWVRK